MTYASRELTQLFRTSKLSVLDTEVTVLQANQQLQEAKFDDLTMAEAREMSARLLSEIQRYDTLRQALQVTRTRLNNMVGRTD